MVELCFPVQIQSPSSTTIQLNRHPEISGGGGGGSVVVVVVVMDQWSVAAQWWWWWWFSGDGGSAVVVVAVVLVVAQWWLWWQRHGGGMVVMVVAALVVGTGSQNNGMHVFTRIRDPPLSPWPPVTHLCPTLPPSVGHGFQKECPSVTPRRPHISKIMAYNCFPDS